MKKIETKIIVPDVGLTPKKVIERAKALRPLLREQQDVFEKIGRYSDEVHDKFNKAGFYRILQPKSFGGYEFDYLTYFKAMLEISKGHPSTGWCLTLASSHTPIFVAHWSEQAQIEVFGKTGHFVSPHRAVPEGDCKPVEDGYLVSGEWSYCSGVPHSTHAMLTTLAPQLDGSSFLLNLMVPAGQYEIIPDWGSDLVLGQKASGSNSIRLENVFVPEHMTSPYIDNLRVIDSDKGTIGTQLHGNSMYLGLSMIVYQAALVTPTLGAAFAALDEYGDMLLTHQTMMPPFIKRADDLDYQRHYGLATAMVDAAEAIWLQAIGQYISTCERWQETCEAPTIEESIRGFCMLQQAGNKACEAVELLFRTSGTSSTRKGTRMMRYFGDVEMYRGHISGQYESWAPMIARARMGMKTGILGVL